MSGKSGGKAAEANLRSESPLLPLSGHLQTWVTSWGVRLEAEEAVGFGFFNWFSVFGEGLVEFVFGYRRMRPEDLTWCFRWVWPFSLSPGPCGKRHGFPNDSWTFSDDFYMYFGDILLCISNFILFIIGLLKLWHFHLGASSLRVMRRETWIFNDS